MSIEFTVFATIPAPPEAIYDAWLDSDGHTKMTGSPAHASSGTGEAFDAWDGYISGRNIELVQAKRIVQSWRTTAFAESDSDSRIEVILEPVETGTEVTLTHSDVPDGHTGYESGWVTHYFEPMKRHFASM